MDKTPSALSTGSPFLKPTVPEAPVRDDDLVSWRSIGSTDSGLSNRMCSTNMTKNSGYQTFEASASECDTVRKSANSHLDDDSLARHMQHESCIEALAEMP